jgi:hypothetical protein
MRDIQGMKEIGRTAASAPSTTGVQPTDSGLAILVEIQERLDEVQSQFSPGRCRRRFPMSWKLQLTPMDQQGDLIHEASVCVFGKDLSMQGVSFSHDKPLSHSRVRISFIEPQIGRFAVEAEIIWTRLTPIGLYESGCRLIRTVPGHKLRMSS